MCGIIRIIGKDQVADRLVDGLRRMEYRGYDSAGVCTVEGGQLDPPPRRGQARQSRQGTRGQSRVRAPSASRIRAGRRTARRRRATRIRTRRANVALVHNGIIENFKPLREALTARGRTFESDTDTEVVAHLVSEQVEAGLSPEDAVKAVLPQLRGAFALAIAFRQHPDLLIGARLGSPLVVGYGEGETYLGSATPGSGAADAEDRLSRRRRLGRHHARWRANLRRRQQSRGARDHDQRRHRRGGREGPLSPLHAEEIFEQPTVVAQTLSSYIRPLEQTVALPQMDFDLSKIDRITIVACGTSFYAGMVAKYWFETFARVPVDIDVASEFRYRDPVLQPGGLALFISQSGETADTLAALRHCKANGQTIAVVVNVPTSSMAREADLLLPTHAGPEIGVASTKAFTCQLAVLAALAAHLALKKGKLGADDEREIVRHLIEAPAALNAALAHDEDIAAMAHLVAPARDVLYLGRGPDYPLALEGALKLKEISYIHAEGYASGEMKHGPIALIDEAVPVIVLAPSGPLFEKTVSNMHEVMARGGKVVLISDAEGLAEAGDGCMATIEMPKVHPLIAPLVYAVPVQLLAYHVAVARGPTSTSRAIWRSR